MVIIIWVLCDLCAEMMSFCFFLFLFLGGGAGGGGVMTYSVPSIVLICKMTWDYNSSSLGKLL